MQIQKIISLLAGALVTIGLGFAPLQQVFAQDARASHRLILEKEAAVKMLEVAAGKRNELIAELKQKKAETCITLDRSECLKRIENEVKAIQDRLDRQTDVDIIPNFAAFKADKQNPEADIDSILAEIERLRDQVDEEKSKFSSQELAQADQRCQQVGLPTEFQNPTATDLKVFRAESAAKAQAIQLELKACTEERELKRRAQCGDQSHCKIQTRRGQATIDDYLAPTDNYIRLLLAQLNNFRVITEQAKTLQLGGPDGLLVVPGQRLFSSPVNLLLAVTTLALRLIGLLAFVVIIFAGFRLLFSAGDDSAITRSKEMIKMAAIGLAVALLAYVIVSVFQGILYA